MTKFNSTVPNQFLLFFAINQKNQETILFSFSNSISVPNDISLSVLSLNQCQQSHLNRIFHSASAISFVVMKNHLKHFRKSCLKQLNVDNCRSCFPVGPFVSEIISPERRRFETFATHTEF